MNGVAVSANAIEDSVSFNTPLLAKLVKDTTTASTYSDGNAKELDRRDIFIRKEVTSVTIQSSSGGSGGSGGGGGHGGGGSHF